MSGHPQAPRQVSAGWRQVRSRPPLLAEPVQVVTSVRAGQQSAMLPNSRQPPATAVVLRRLGDAMSFQCHDRPSVGIFTGLGQHAGNADITRVLIEGAGVLRGRRVAQEAGSGPRRST